MLKAPFYLTHLPCIVVNSGFVLVMPPRIAVVISGLTVVVSSVWTLGAVTLVVSPEPADIIFVFNCVDVSTAFPVVQLAVTSAYT